MTLNIAPDAGLMPLYVRTAGAAGLPVVLSIPHAGRWLPAALAAQTRVPLATLARLNDGWADMIAAPLVAAGASVVAARLCRAVADCNRSEGDMDPADVAAPLRAHFGPPGRKARAGLGVVPTRLPGSGALWRTPLTDAAMTHRLELLHRPYHAALARVVDALRRRHGAVLLVDMHSMPSLLPTRGDPAPARIIIGDRHGRAAAPWLAAMATAHPAPQEARVGVNQPYAGGHILERHGQPQQGCHAVQVEFDRALYLDAAGLPDAARALALGDWLMGLVLRWCDALAGDSALPVAAE
jgi:N-formylglutamate amidohydrolase